MRRKELDDLAAFAMVAAEVSFTRAAASLGMSLPALRHPMRGLEERLKVRLLARTTHSVSTTEGRGRAGHDHDLRPRQTTRARRER